MTTAGGSSSGHCLGEAGSTLPYLPFVELLGRLFSDEPEVADDLIAAHPSLGPLLQAHLRGPSAEASESHRGDLFESLHAGLEHLAATQPLLVVIEDVHWADQSSRELLSLLLTRGFLGPVSLVISFRSDDLHRRHPLRATLANWSRLAQVRRIDLGPPRASRDARAGARAGHGRGGRARRPRGRGGGRAGGGQRVLRRGDRRREHVGPGRRRRRPVPAAAGPLRAARHHRADRGPARLGGRAARHP